MVEKEKDDKAFCVQDLVEIRDALQNVVLYLEALDRGGFRPCFFCNEPSTQIVCPDCFEIWRFM